ncbi:amidohydrolase family protein [Olsenella intestinalis]|uniref:amidohydrolase family protein n=1 Tax=Olsenella intestinalis TaxID=2930083 RepID=UPI0031FF2EC7
MFIDIHVHPAFYEPINSDPVREEMRHEVLDIHLNGTAKLAHIENQMRLAGLDKMCLLGQDYLVTEGVTPVSNEEVQSLVDLRPDRFIGFASVDPHDPAAAEKLERAFVELGLVGLNLHPGRQRFYPMDDCVQPLYDICERHDRPVMFHAGMSWEPHTLAKFGRPVEFEELAEARPNLRFCLGHFAWPWLEEAAMLMVKHRNVYADTAALYFDCAREFYDRLFTQELPLTWIDRSLRHQVMFGSDNPRFEQIRMARALEGLGLRESTLELVKGENALEFLYGRD